MSDKYSRCPDCGQKSVYFRMWANGEDHYKCRNSKCDFFFYTLSDLPTDHEQEARWEAAQPTTPP